MANGLFNGVVCPVPGAVHLRTLHEHDLARTPQALYSWAELVQKRLHASQRATEFAARLEGTNCIDELLLSRYGFVGARTRRALLR
jgi:hypothetical protein